MKQSIIYLGIALVTFTNVALALEYQQSLSDEIANANQIVYSSKQVAANTIDSNLKKRKHIENERIVESTPETISIPTYQKTIEEIIADNNQIIESGSSNDQIENDLIEINFNLNPVSEETVIQERILQDMQIIESPIAEALQPIASDKRKK